MNAQYKACNEKHVEGNIIKAKPMSLYGKKYIEDYPLCTSFFWSIGLSIMYIVFLEYHLPLLSIF